MKLFLIVILANFIYDVTLAFLGVLISKDETPIIEKRKRKTFAKRFEEALEKKENE